MPKTVEQIKAEVTALVKSQGNQGALSLGTVLDDITELAGEGGGGGGSLPFRVHEVMIGFDDESNIIVITSQEDLKKIYDAVSDQGAGADVVHISFQALDTGLGKEVASTYPPLVNVVKNTTEQKVVFAVTTFNGGDDKSITGFAISSEGVATVFKYPLN